ncbi:MAG: uracil-DNA glycosylase [Bacteroidales bacterium]|jgi:DNA polymerase|nr:uracil-DNA glycosylase [Bacteroidales bacterium]MDD3105983.1 uracil-DNA glycosylase [Bacteroidales bacterium]MDD3548883.1 uracil-DNA glycosylase [Bacteroidales bacterium]MDD4065135.1 uracil-DNA glycosylase [Bacteroidales bacterium]MDD5283135.1 uracil-DNA glycosylase [Bacteroidales bacterium]
MTESFRQQVLNCTRCDLWKTRKHVIFGEGNPNADILIIGEAPGRDEDLIGRPFVGVSGQLLDKILAACNFTRQKHVFISNIVKCRPPDNRVPTAEEASRCIPWLYEQIELINPKIMVLLGATALRYMAGPGYKITRDRGQWFTCMERQTMAVYHPAALLRNPDLKRDTWTDFKNIVLKYRELSDPQHSCQYV